MTDFANNIAKKCIDLYNKLGKNGKPHEGREWTQLAGIVSQIEDKFRVVSLATGSKCIGANSMSPEGIVVNDSHAEVLARRAFIRFMFEEMKTLKNGDPSEIMTMKASKFIINENVKWHMYTSQVPCGDASIVPMEELEDGVEPSCKRQKIDIHRTGAKPTKSDPRQDSKKAGVEYHTRGAVRTKPGRGDPTLSLSCSDKIARWIHTGLQGGLLSHLIEGEVRLSSLIVGGGGPYCQEVLEEALLGRADLRGIASAVNIAQATLVFPYSPTACEKGRPCPTSIVWSDVANRPLEVCVEGRRLGTTSKTADKGIIRVAKREFLRLFLLLCPDESLKNLSYREIKDRAKSYQSLSKDFKQKMGAWSEKPDYERFSL